MMTLTEKKKKTSVENIKPTSVVVDTYYYWNKKGNIRYTEKKEKEMNNVIGHEVQVMTYLSQSHPQDLTMKWNVDTELNQAQGTLVVEWRLVGRVKCTVTTNH